MLTDQEKEKIRLEEIYRSEVRQSLSPNEKRSTLWSFLNSPFGLWLLSTVVIGIATGLYQAYNRSLEARIANESKKRNLTSEIEFRLKPIEPMQNFGEILVYLNQLDSPTVNRYGLNEYKDRTFNSLIRELEELTPGSSRSGLFKSFQEIQKAPTKENDNVDNFARFRMFCYHWAEYTINRPSGALTPPIEIVSEDGKERPSTQEDMNKPLK